MKDDIRKQIEEALLLGLANHTNEFLNPGFAPGLTHEQRVEILKRIMNSRLIERVEKLLSDTRKRALDEVLKALPKKIETPGSNPTAVSWHDDVIEEITNTINTLKEQL